MTGEFDTAVVVTIGQDPTIVVGGLVVDLGIDGSGVSVVVVTEAVEPGDHHGGFRVDVFVSGVPPLVILRFDTAVVEVVTSVEDELGIDFRSSLGELFGNDELIFFVPSTDGNATPITNRSEGETCVNKRENIVQNQEGDGDNERSDKKNRRSLDHIDDIDFCKKYSVF